MCQIEIEDRVDSIMYELDKYVYSRAGFGYIEKDYVMKDRPMHGISQVRDEIKEFVEVILRNDKLSSALEIGLGEFGGTFRLWKMIFDRVVSIEMDINFYIVNEKENCGGKGRIIIGNSQEKGIIRSLYRRFKSGVDLLFIDGGHDYNSVLQDYMNYKGLLREGSIVAFHDSETRIGNYGVYDVLSGIEKGLYGEREREIKHIRYSENVGMAYIIWS